MNVLLRISIQSFLLILLTLACMNFWNNNSYGHSALPATDPDGMLMLGMLLTTTPSNTSTVTPTETPTGTPTLIGPCAAMPAAGVAAPNCTTTPSLTPTPNSAPDLLITEMIWRYLPATCDNGQNLGPIFDITVANIGGSAAGAFVVTFNNQSSVVSDSLAAGAMLLISFPEGAQFSGENTATADSGNAVNESDESNNSYTLPFPLPYPTPLPTCTPGGSMPTHTPTPTITSTPSPVFDVRVNVEVSQTTVEVGETITALVTIDNQSIGCQYPVLDLTLSQQGDTIFRFDSPAVVGPGVSAQTLYTLTAINPGVTILHASAYGERNCGNGWQWTYANGVSPVITSTDATDVLPGDGNGDGTVNAADLSACVLEIFDGDGSDPADAPNGSFAGTAGCDANVDNAIDAADISCTVLLIFNGPGICATATDADQMPPAILAIGAAVPIADESIAVPVTLVGNDHAISAVAFALQLDDTFDPADEDADGIPDAVQVSGLPDNVTVTVTWQMDRLAVMLYGDTTPLATLPDGPLLTLLLSAGEGRTVTFDATLPPSLGSKTGATVPLQIESSTRKQILLPLIAR